MGRFVNSYALAMSPRGTRHKPIENRRQLVTMRSNCGASAVDVVALIIFMFCCLFSGSAATGVRDENIEARALALAERSRRNGSHDP